jgi:hypothetical protein
MANKYLHGDASWSTPPTWYDAAGGITVVSAPGAGDTAYPNGHVLTCNVATNYACDFVLVSGDVVFVSVSGATFSGSITIASGGIWSPFGGVAWTLSGSMVVAASGKLYQQSGAESTLTVSAGATFTVPFDLSWSGAYFVGLSIQAGAIVTLFGQRVYVAGDSVDPGVANVVAGTPDYLINGGTRYPIYYPPTRRQKS